MLERHQFEAEKTKAKADEAEMLAKLQGYDKTSNILILKV